MSKRISDFEEASSLNGGENILIVQNGVTKKIKVSEILKLPDQNTAGEIVDFKESVNQILLEEGIIKIESTEW